MIWKMFENEKLSTKGKTKRKPFKILKNCKPNPGMKIPLFEDSRFSSLGWIRLLSTPLPARGFPGKFNIPSPGTKAGEDPHPLASATPEASLVRFSALLSSSDSLMATTRYHGNSFTCQAATLSQRWTDEPIGRSEKIFNQVSRARVGPGAAPIIPP